MTLAEIRADMPKLQQTIDTLTQSRKQFTADIEDIDAQIRAAETLTRDDQETIDRCEKFLSENESSTVPEIVSRVKDYKKRQEDARKAIQDREKTVSDLRKDRKDIEDNPVNKQMLKEISEARAKLDDIFETLEKDPIINAKLQEAIKYEFFSAIQAQRTESAQYAELSSKIEAAIKDGSSDGLKNLVEATAKRKETFLKSMYDDKIDAKSAQSNFLNSSKALVNQIKTKFGVEIKSREDIDYILDYASGKITGEFKLPSAEKKMGNVDRIIAKLEEKRDARLAELGAKAVAPAAPENTAEIEDNKKIIEQLQKENVESFNPAIAEATQKIDEIDAKIDAKTKVTPEDKKALEDAEKELKDKHIISEEVVTDLKDENSDISKLFKEFVDADLELRRAFRKNEYDKTDEAKQVLQDAILKYKGIAEQLASESGYDIKSWQIYNKNLINDKIEDGEKVDFAYTYPEKRNFYNLIKDKNVKKSDEAVAAFNDTVKQLDAMDEMRDNILDGDFSKAAELPKEYEEYHNLIDSIQSHSGPNVNVRGVILGSALIKPSALGRFKNFIHNTFDKITGYRVYFDVPDQGDTKKLVDAFLSKKPGASLSKEDKEEIEKLKEERKNLVSSRQILQDKKDSNDRTISELETKNADLISRDAARTTSELGTEEERGYVDRMGIDTAYVQGSSVKEDIKKVIDDEGR